MKKWFFSHDGDVSGPLTQSEAIAFLQNEPDCYGWHPSFTQWLPVSHIGEFAGVVPPPTSPAEIPTELINEFNTKRNELHEKINEMDESVKYSKTYLYELEQEINIYKRLTSKLSDDVKNNINTIENKYEGYQKILEELVDAVSIAKSEITEVTSEFDKRVVERAQDQASVPTPPQAILDSTPNVSLDPVVAKPTSEPIAASLDPVVTKPAHDPISASLDPVATKSLSEAITSSLDPVATKSLSEAITSSLDPVATKSLSEAITSSLDPVATKSLSLDPIATPRSALDPIASPSLSLDPIPTKSLSLDPVAVKATNLDNVAEIRPRTASLDPQPIRPSASLDNVAVRLKPGESIDDIAPKKSQEKIDNIQFSEELKNNIEQKLEKVFEESPAVPTEKTSKKSDTEKTKTEAPAKLQGVTSILKSVFRGDKKVEPKQEVKLDSPVTLAHSNDNLDDDHDEHDDHHEEKNGTTGDTSADKEGRMRRRSRRRR
ncbi:MULTISPECIES: DUF4339 domain-containing protein [Pseudomonadati]|uniref:GYF domain-containing protein n=1 Tax=Shewanella aestuarii TaxID=1028752 RepID=A0ABT0L045_9GAMM|nr:DUF4339 domain-containing protein [Shewanella aestuarii]MCL1116845.1 GYF domain-containing protein [Shewanella aestuarii]GGN73505.1 hypothetical protein GCM10009193_11560 [Shewanella aestuarii]